MIYFDEGDYRKFLEIVEEASTEYAFEIYSFCLMPNHYHLLVETKEENLSRFMQKIGSRYTVYFNKKYDRVGPLWQSRFKAYFVYTERYLYTLVRYIEFNPIKAEITREIGAYRWAMSSAVPAVVDELSMLNYDLLQKVSLDTALSKDELAQIDELYRSKSDSREENQSRKTDQAPALPPLSSYFEPGEDTSGEKTRGEKALGQGPGGPQPADTRLTDAEAVDVGIVRAIRDGHHAVDVGRYLGLSKAAISKRSRNFARKEKLFEKLKDKGLFWSYRKDLSYQEVGGALLIEHCLKYADSDDIKLCYELFGVNRCRRFTGLLTANCLCGEYMLYSPHIRR